MLFILSKFFNLYQIKLIVYLFFYIINRMQINQTSFICKYDNCNKYFKEPVILTCGFSICREHIDDLVKNNIQNFKCNSCQQDHSSTQNYILNMTLKHLITEENSHLKGNLLEMRKLLDSFEQTLNEIDKIQQDPANYLYEYVNEQKRKIELQREELKLQIDKISDQLIKKIDDLNAQFSTNLDKIDLDEYKRTVQNYEENHLRNPNIPETDFKKLILNLKKIHEEANTNLWIMTRKLRNNKKFDFKPKLNKLETNMFGCLKLTPDVKLKFSRRLDGHKSYINAAIYYPDNKLITGSDDKSIKIWDLKTNKCLVTLCNNYPIGKLVLSLDNTKLIVAQIIDDEICEYIIKVVCLKSFKFIAELETQFSTLYDFCFLPNGDLITSDLEGIKLWNMNNFAFIRELPEEIKYLEHMNITSDNTKLIGLIDINYTSSIRVICLKKFNVLAILPGFSDVYTYCVKLLSNDQTVISGHEDGIRIWNIEKRELTRMVLSDILINRIILIQNENYFLADGDINLYLCNLNNETEPEIVESMNNSSKNFSKLAGLLPNDDLITITNNKICIYENLLKD